MNTKLKRKWKQSLGCGVCITLFLSGASPAFCASAASYKTQEYGMSTGLDLINAADAYEQGYTGKGIWLGVCDQYTKLSHPEFLKKLHSSTLSPVSADYNWNMWVHGTLVGGIMVAAKDDVGMHGVAFDADLVSGLLYDENGMYLQSTYTAFNGNSNVKIINNSWGPNGYIDVIGQGKEGVLEALAAENIDIAVLADSITNYDKVLVFAAGNNGHTTPSPVSLLPYLKPETKSNFINVVAVDSARYNKTINTAATNFTSLFSDLTKYVEENSIAAPGQNIYSSISIEDGYDTAIGTSFAAPHVTATAGLVQQAFPYMNGKQIVDTVLSTANHTFTLPAYTLSLQQDTSADGTLNCKVNLYYFGSKPNTVAIESDLASYYNSNEVMIKKFSNYTSLADFLTEVRVVYENVPRELIYGQGLLDVGAAVRGPGFLNARRMDSSNFSSSYEKNQALYAIDTKGYDTDWSNDISEKRAGLLTVDSPYDDLKAIYNYYKQSDVLNNFSQGQSYIDEYNAAVIVNGLQGLPVGLVKTGLGRLTLTGTNTYQGSSIAAGGVLQIDGSVAGDAFSVDTGTIAGSGIIQGNLRNYSVVQPGSNGTPGTLTVNGELISAGKIAVAMNNTSYSKLSVAGTAAVDGTSFTAVTGSAYHPGTYTGVLTASSITGEFQSNSAFTGMLSAEGRQAGNSITLTLAPSNNLENPTTAQTQAYNQMNLMYNQLGETQQREMSSLYSLSASQAKQALTEISGGAQLNQAAMIQSSTVIGKAIAARLSSVTYPVTNEVTFKLTGFVPTDLTAKTVISLDPADNWWMNISKNWGSMDARQELPSLNNQSFSFVMGRDEKNSENWRTGFMFGYEKNEVASSLAKTQSHGYRLGMYAGYNRDAVDIQTHLAYGKQNNDAKRYLTQLGLEADSKYDSSTISLGVKARYNLHYGQDKAWQVSPYTDVDVTWYDQDRFNESGAGVYNQEADPFNNTYSTGEIGLEMARNLSKGRLAVNVGYKKVLGGSDPTMTIAYSGNPNSKLTVSGNRQDSEYVVLGLNYQAEFAKDWTLNAQIDSEQGSHSKTLTASIAAKRVW